MADQNSNEPPKHSSFLTHIVDFTYDIVRPTPNPKSFSKPQSNAPEPVTSTDGITTMTVEAQKKVKWEYAVPILATPLAHMFVSLIRQYPQHKRKLYWGVGIATFLTIQARLILFYDAGYPGQEKAQKDPLPAFLRYLLF
jgi:hypothetical protein